MVRESIDLNYDFDSNLYYPLCLNQIVKENVDVGLHVPSGVLKRINQQFC